MLLTFVASMLTVYFVCLLGVSGLAKIDRPFVELGGPGTQRKPKALFFSLITGRLLGAFEVVLAFLLSSGIRTQLVAMVNAGLFGAFLLFKLYLLLTKQGSKCGCFGAHELIAIDLSSVMVSTLILGLALILAVLAQWSSGNTSNWIIAIIFLLAFGLLAFKTFRRRQLERQLIQPMSTGTDQ